MVVLSNNLAEASASIEAMLRADPVTETDISEALSTTKPASDVALQSK
jgi:hypothetical protein